MNVISLLNISSFILILGTIVILIYKYFVVKPRNYSINLILISFVVLLIVNLTNVLEHLNITDYFDLFEDEIEIIFIPLFIFALFTFNLKKELNNNKKIRNNLQDSNTRLNISMKGANEALWEWDTLTGIFKINPDFCFLNFKPCLYLIKEENIEDCIHPDSVNVFKQLLFSMNGNIEIPENTEIQIKAVDLTYHWVLIRGKKNEQGPNLLNTTYLGIIFDINLLKKTHFELSTALQKAEENNQLKSKFLANLSHEIRTPMNGILGFTDLLYSTDFNNPKRQEYINNIQDSGKQLVNIFSDIVEISKIDTGQISYSPTEIDICKLFKELYIEFKIILNDKNIQLLINIPVETSISIKTDPVLLKQIFKHLINNAVKYTQEGWIEIAFNILITENIIEFSVKDTGIGIDNKHFNVIFERFRQINSKFSNLEGLGLGLPIVKAYVEFLGGKIWLNSELNKGTTFSFTIPLNSYNKASIPKTEIITSNQTDISNDVILIAEDDETNYLYLNEVLIKNKYKTIRAKNGKEVVEICKSNPSVTLVLMDIKMPILNGLEATKQIKLFRADLPVIAQTAYAYPDDEQKIKDAGCDGYLPKPILKDSLFRLMNELRNKNNNIN
jgi:signal transduction histidine kinase/ActR/RegA family two-component response regulator